MKVFICLLLVAAFNVAVNQAAAINAQEQISTHHNGEPYNAVIAEHSRQRRDSGNGQASVDIKQNRGTTSVNAQVGRVWESNNGRTRVEANANYGRDYGRGGSKPNYGGNIGISHKW